MDEETESDAREAEMLREHLAEPAAEPTLAEDLHELIGDGRALIEAELNWQKARVSFAGRQAKGIVLLGLLAAALAFCALVALIFGLVLALAPVLTAWGAMAAVTGGLLLTAGLAGVVAGLRARRMVRLIANRKGET